MKKSISKNIIYAYLIGLMLWHQIYIWSLFPFNSINVEDDVFKYISIIGFIACSLISITSPFVYFKYRKKQKINRILNYFWLITVLLLFLNVFCVFISDIKSQRGAAERAHQEIIKQKQ